VDAHSGAQAPGEYVVGGIKRGPSGVIGTNKKDAQETVDAILEDLFPTGDGATAHVPRRPDPQEVLELLNSRQPALVTYSGWEAIDRHERALGASSGRPRVKLTRIEELLQAAAAQEP
jgi:ferredoxin--NADP+ reductase